MLILEKLLFTGSKKETILEALFDTGASISCVNPSKVKTLGGIKNLLHPFEAGTAGKEKILITQVIYLEFMLNKIRMSDIFYLVPGLDNDIIIGVPTMQKWHIKLDPKQGKIITNPRVAILRI